MFPLILSHGFIKYLKLFGWNVFVVALMASISKHTANCNCKTVVNIFSFFPRRWNGSFALYRKIIQFSVISPLWLCFCRKFSKRFLVVGCWLLTAHCKKGIFSLCVCCVYYVLCWTSNLVLFRAKLQNYNILKATGFFSL